MDKGKIVPASMEEAASDPGAYWVGLRNDCAARDDTQAWAANRIYLSMKRDPERVARSMDEIENNLARLRQETDMSEDEMAQWLNIRDPLPD